MSYTRPDTGNPMNDYFSALTDFTILAPRLLDARNLQDFLVWLDKLQAIDPRSLLLYLRANRDRLTKGQLAAAQRKLRTRI